MRRLLPALLLLAACGPDAPAQTPPEARPPKAPAAKKAPKAVVAPKIPASAPVALTHPEEAARVSAALARAVAWAGALDLDPIKLREERGMKGIKHFVEYLDLLHLAYQWPADPALSAAARARAVEVLAVTDAPAYHSLGAADDQRFREDSMSYLRACMLAERFGKDTARYRGEIEELLPRLYGHLSSRGVDQRMGFALLLGQLELPRTEAEGEVYPESLIARRAPLSYYAGGRDRPYDITHEIFAMTWRGARALPFPDKGDARYAEETVSALLTAALERGDLDLGAELLVNLAELGRADSELARKARAWILDSQNADGSWGRYEEEARQLAETRPRYSVPIGGYLHTTMVCAWALVVTS
jgi:hypothetical protein